MIGIALAIIWSLVELYHIRYPKRRKLPRWLRNGSRFVVPFLWGVLYITDPIKSYIDDQDTSLRHAEVMDAVRPDDRLIAPLGTVHPTGATELSLTLGTITIGTPLGGRIGYFGINAKYCVRAFARGDELLVDADWYDERGTFAAAIRQNVLVKCVGDIKREPQRQANEFAILLPNGSDALRVRLISAGQAMLTGTFFTSNGSRIVFDGEGMHVDMTKGDRAEVGFAASQSQGE